MKSGSKTKEFEPRPTAVANLFKENLRLQRLCAAHRKQIRGMQKNAEILKMKYQLAMVRLAAVSVEGLVEELATLDAKVEASLPAPTMMVAEEHA
jgi:predicted RNA binding protein with dsRBD fold (UPF0201 family)